MASPYVPLAFLATTVLAASNYYTYRSVNRILDDKLSKVAESHHSHISSSVFKDLQPNDIVLTKVSRKD